MIIRSFESRSLIDPISLSRRCRLKIRFSRAVDWSDVGSHDEGEVKTQGSLGSRVDSVNFVKKRGVQHREGEDYVRSVEGTVKHV